MQVEAIADKIKSSPFVHKPVLIGIEGFGGSGKSTIANKLADLLNNAFVVNIDDFIIKENITENDWDKQAFDRQRLEAQVLKPASESELVNYQKLLWDADTLSEPIRVPDVDYLIVEGISSYHPSIAHYYDYKIWVDTPIEVAKARGKKRDTGNENEQHWDLWAANDLGYQEKYHPEKIADFVVKNNDIEFREVTVTDIDELKSWFTRSSPGNRFINDYADVDAWLKLISDDPYNRFGYLIYRDSQPVAFLDLELNNDNSASIAFGVKPELRGQGLGKMIINEVTALSNLQGIKKIHAGVEPENVASQRVLQANGFVRMSEEDGIIEFEKEITR